MISLLSLLKEIEIKIQPKIGKKYYAEGSGEFIVAGIGKESGYISIRYNARHIDKGFRSMAILSPEEWNRSNIKLLKNK